jgi:ligand-binding sensor protein
MNIMIENALVGCVLGNNILIANNQSTITMLVQFIE